MFITFVADIGSETTADGKETHIYQGIILTDKKWIGAISCRDDLETYLNSEEVRNLIKDFKLSMLPVGTGDVEHRVRWFCEVNPIELISAEMRFSRDVPPVAEPCICDMCKEISVVIKKIEEALAPYCVKLELEKVDLRLCVEEKLSKLGISTKRFPKRTLLDRFTEWIHRR